MSDDESLERTGAVSVLRFRRRLAHAPSTVWAALTQDEQLEAWFPTTIEGDRATGAPLRFSFRQSEGAPFEGEMTCYDPPTVLELRWGDDLLRFELRPHSGGGQEGCVLTLTVTFPEHRKAARDAAGWHVCLEQLAYVCARTSPPWDPAERWRAVHPRYVERLGPEASLIGPPEEWERAHGGDAGDVAADGADRADDATADDRQSATRDLQP
jgi:uncharacterized protein YndB with AHSA1/START domain